MYEAGESYTMMKEDEVVVVLAIPRDTGSGIGCLDVPLGSLTRGEAT